MMTSSAERKGVVESSAVGEAAWRLSRRCLGASDDSQVAQSGR